MHKDLLNAAALAVAATSETPSDNDNMKMKADLFQIVTKAVLHSGF